MKIKNFNYLDIILFLMSNDSILLRKKENERLQEIFYKGAKQIGSYQFFKKTQPYSDNYPLLVKNAKKIFF